MSSILETRFWTRIQKRRWIEKMTIGIIEDDCLLSQSLELLLQREGYRTVCMYSQKEAETQLRWTEDLLLVDIGLPDGNGMTLYQKLCRNWDKKIPAIFLTARDEEIDMLNAFELGAEDYVVKPFSMKVLLKRIEVVLKRNKGEATHESVICCRNLMLLTTVSVCLSTVCGRSLRQRVIVPILKMYSGLDTGWRSHKWICK